LILSKVNHLYGTDFYHLGNEDLAMETAACISTPAERNGWLQVNGQVKNYGVDINTFVAEVSASATAEAQPAQ